jgi:uncharacterized protein (DUF1800 family)
MARTLAPAGTKPMSFGSERSRIGHLLRRAGFGATRAELEAAVTRGYDATLDLLLDPQDDHDAAEDVLGQQTFQLNRLDEAQRQWLVRMRYTSRPLVEKMTLFWHNHFATAFSKVNGRDFNQLRAQIDMFRSKPMGNFRDLLLDVSRDPAMLIWLDGRLNHKNAPNENYGRELLELFTMGVGNYSEDDVKAAAHAFTGWTLSQDGAKFVFKPEDHDYGRKAFLGKTDNFNGDDIVNVLAGHQATAQYLAKKLVRFFVSDPPNPALVDDLASTYLSSHYDLRSVLKRLFKSEVFTSEGAYHALVKSPVEFVVGTLRTLDVQTTGQGLPAALRTLGQELYNPPNVAGWPGGTTWIATDTMLSRHNLVNGIVTAGKPESGLFVDPQALLGAAGNPPVSDVVRALATHVVDGDLDAVDLSRLYAYAGGTASSPMDLSKQDLKLRGLLYLLLTTPVYQLN